MATRSGFLASTMIVLCITDGLGSQAIRSSAPTKEHRISARAIGPIALGMTLDEARRAVPFATFQRASDGDGAALVEVILRGKESLILSAHEDDPGIPIDWAKPIRTIETVDPAFSTDEGIRVGTRLVAAARVWGAVREIVESEIESRQFVTFERQPAALTIRIDYTGLFAAGTRRTVRYRPDAKIMALAISSE